MSVGRPMANYAASRRCGDFILLSGVVAVDPTRHKIVGSYEDIPAAAQDALRGLGFVTGQMSVDVFEAPIVAQSWFVLDRIRQLVAEHGGAMNDAVKLVQYFRNLSHYALYNRVRGLFYPEQPPVSTVVEVPRFLPSDEVLVEVEATVYLPQRGL
ncbi:RidA family protein [Pseudorhodoferax sp. Leaf265]|uniref:RidA family protein n=1 Tax=Pseudorhodoferax sp. Leaf265 TaxID=1736315 RepID=UPI000700AAAD|nr:Rid family hydrolase [Pseudorhodoferax sp. Leaf265]KQP08524.1 enamine deaminase RidA [Pseudorhodoferax sp. Leaf265]